MDSGAAEGLPGCRREAASSGIPAAHPCLLLAAGWDLPGKDHPRCVERLASSFFRQKRSGAGPADRKPELWRLESFCFYL